MSQLTYERSPMIDVNLSRVLNENGFTDLSHSPFLGQLINAIKEAVKAPYGRLYEIPKNVDIGRATGTYLDRWGNILGETRRSIAYASDLSLSNAVIFLEPEVMAGEITTDGRGLVIPKGRLLTDDGGQYELRLIDDLYMLPDRSTAYARVVSTREGKITIPPGGITSVNYSLANIDNVMPSALSRFRLLATNLKAITGGESYADDATYQYVLQEKGASMGLVNDRRINTLMDSEAIVNVKIQSYFGGVDVYIETRDIANNDAVVVSAQAAINAIWPLGTGINVYAPLNRTLTLQVQLELASDAVVDETYAWFRDELITEVNNRHMGDVLDFTAIVQTIKQRNAFIVGTRVRGGTYNGRTLTGTRVAQHFNEKAYLSASGVTI